MSKKSLVFQTEQVMRRIYVVRGHKVMLGVDLAELYDVETKALNRQVKRNLDRFPEDFMFKLTVKELEDLRCQIGTSSWGGHRYAPFAFTEQGVAMLSSVLNSKRAIQVNIAIMRAFVKLRQVLGMNKDLAAKLEGLERKYRSHDIQIHHIFHEIRRMMQPDPELLDVGAPRRIGFMKRSR